MHSVLMLRVALIRRIFNIMSNEQPTTCLNLDEIHHLALTALESNGFARAQANSIASSVTAAERDGCTSHGLFRVSFYINALQNPSADANAVPSLQVDDSTVVHVDGKNGFCPQALDVGLPALVKKARMHGTAALAIHNVYNIAALWPEVECLARQGLVAFAFTTSNAYVTPAGGTRPLFGTNPMAFGFPREAMPPLVFDQASSASARGEIQLHQRDGQPIPDGWAIDDQGRPTNDPDAALAGAQLPFGGHKGASIALMVELLAGALIGENFSVDSSNQDTHKVGAPFGGELLLAIDPSKFGSTAYLQRAELLFSQVLDMPGTRLPSQRRYEQREKSVAQGVEIPARLLAELAKMTKS